MPSSFPTCLSPRTRWRRTCRPKRSNSTTASITRPMSTRPTSCSASARRSTARRWSRSSARRRSKGDDQAVQQRRPALEPQLLLAMPGARRGPEADRQAAELIEEEFGGTDDAAQEARRRRGADHFSNGWAWLVLDRGKLKITSLHDADTPLVHDGMTPLFTLDVWEHAYYIDYRNERPKFAEAVLVEHRQLGVRRAEPRRRRAPSRADQDSAASATERNFETIDA